MSVQHNPFTPTFGIVPLHLAGRATLLAEMASAFDSGPGNPNLSTLLIGPRGCGKTALLACIVSAAQEHGWIAVRTVAAPGMLDDIIQRALESAAEFVEKKGRRHLTGINIAQVLGLEWAVDDESPANWRTRMNALLSELDKRDVGLLICVDEVDVGVDELIQLASIYQMFIGEGRKVALVMAGLPKKTTELVDDDRVSFLRRTRQRRLGRIPDTEIERAFRRTVEDSGKTISDEALKMAVEATAGYAYMMQLVGYCMWENAGESTEISEKHAERGVEQARTEFRDGVLRSTYREMSKGDRAFAAAMLPDRDGSRLADIARRMGKRVNYASTYRTRLLSLGAIDESDEGVLDFAIPLLREYLEEKLAESSCP